MNLEKHDADAAATQTLDPEQLSALGEERQRLQARLEEAKVKEAAAKREALGRSTVIVDAAKRAQQQAEIADELRNQAAKQPPSAQTPQQQSPPSSGPSLTPQTPAQGPQLLPGAPRGDDPIALAAKTVPKRGRGRRGSRLPERSCATAWVRTTAPASRRSTAS